MNLKLKYGLPFADVVITHKGKSLSFDNFLIVLALHPQSLLPKLLWNWS